MIESAPLWVIRPASFRTHEFPEGVVLYDTSDKFTLYLPHPAGEVIVALKINSCGLDSATILGELSASESSAGLDASELEVILEELERLQLISARE